MTPLILNVGDMNIDILAASIDQLVKPEKSAKVGTPANLWSQLC